MTDAVAEFRSRLSQERARLVRTVVTTDEELATLEVHQAGGLTEDAANDLATAVLSRLEGQHRHELDEIAAAEARLASGTFGSCETCGEAIAVARLRAVPTARLCVRCQERVERT